MNELIKVQTNVQEEPTVSGRELHEFLEVKTAYKDWFPRMIEYGFVEDVDYQILTEKVDAQKRARTYEQFNHAIKLDMAKEIAMIQRSEKGRQARQYFLSLEKDWNSPEKVMARALKYAEQRLGTLQLENSQQKQIIGELQPKATYYDLVLQNKSLLAISVIAKDYGTGAPTMNKKLNDLGVQYQQSGVWLLYAKYQSKGYTSSKTQEYVDSKGNPQSKMHTYWTQKGRLFIYELLKQQGVLPLIEREG